jgi:flavin reductase (DIM6/NTAB) family NADH-FMN oxidoreductase RutF
MSQAILKAGETGGGVDGINPLELRRALGEFATGVTIVTARDVERGVVGLTVNSFASVSLEPPLVLWSLSRRSSSLRAFEAAGHFAVNVLAAEQKWLSDRFVRPAADKFAGVDWQPGAGGAPVLDGCIASFECRTRHCLDGGDHVIFLGEVERLSRRDGEPLLFLGGRYRLVEPLV